MVLSGASDPKFHQDYVKEFFKRGKKKISEYSNLAQIVDNFSGFDPENYSNNIFLNLATDAEHDIFRQGPNKHSAKLLETYDKIIDELQISDWPREKRSNLISKARSFKDEQAFSIYTELELYRQLKEIPEITKLEYGSISNSNHDFRFVLGEQEYNAELTAISDGAITRIIQDGLTETAHAIENKVPDKKILKLDVNTSMILEKNNNSAEKIRELLTEKILSLLPIIQNTSEVIIHFHNLGTAPEKTLYEQKEILQYYPDLKKSIQNLQKTKEGITYLKNTKIKDISPTPITSSIYCPAKARLIEIHTQQLWPSDSEQKRQDSLIKQITRAFEQKLDKNQLHKQANPIIIIQIQDYLIQDEFMIGKEALEKISKDIENKFIEKKKEEILCCIIWSRDITKNNNNKKSINR